MHKPLPKPVAALLALGVASSLAACSFEPKLRVPPAPSDKMAYTAGKSPVKTVTPGGMAGAAQEIQYGTELHEQWWKLFHSKALDTLISVGLKNSPTIAAAQAQMREAQATARANASIFYPQVTGTLQANRSKSTAATFGGSGGIHYALINGSLGVSYYPDIFGVNKLVYRNSEELVKYQQWQLEAAKLTLTGNIVTTAIDEAATAEQIQATRAIIAHEKKLLELTENQYRAGAIDYSTVMTQKSQMASEAATLPPLEQQLAVYRHELAILVGAFPANAKRQNFTLTDLKLPEKLPVSLPSQLLQQRPDIRAVMAQMKAANAQIGEARAQFYPTVKLTAAFGNAASNPNIFFDPVSSIWSLVGSMSQPLFEGGKLEAQKAEAHAAYDALYANYRSTVLNAFDQVANGLRAVEHDAQALAAQREALSASREALKLAQASYRAGASDYLTLLTAEVQYNTAKIAEIKAQSQRYQDSAALLVALGGGWWNKPDQKSATTPTHS
ncbi:efflux transporter outer membrane subunit [Acidithiobacillus sp.]|uniref:efflux transporter outer membrane subunit n=1 Tax=Acidithiobacillus sp. TaxID=1872118 RepID=UPI0026188512|nr:efflux transporter outer membrane subunit [Acidithiobacillus sp.]MDD5280587.1 efflux transporter outer membrane subunit [Acidithiobacillus sp.]